MPRIRTIKPEFFRSPDIALLDFPQRIFYQALWCWADDFGVGETNLNGLLGFAFPDEDGFTAQDLRRFCADIAQTLRVDFYTVRGRHYYAIPTWENHQKLEKRTDRRKYPAPDDPDAKPDQRIYGRADSAPTMPRKSGAESRECGAGTGEREQGKGNKEEETCATPLRDPETPTAPARFDEFWSAYPLRRDRRKAEKAFANALKRTTATAIIDGALRYAQDPNREDRYTKYAEGWLNGDGWLDDPLPARNNASTQQGAATTKAAGWLALGEQVANTQRGITR